MASAGMGTCAPLVTGKIGVGVNVGVGVGVKVTVEVIVGRWVGTGVTDGLGLAVGEAKGGRGSFMLEVAVILG